ncbi:MAG: AAA family ATPase [Halopseudomonas sp.]|uniref:AAA family ATPase n=1 Tax=Halopseudomonas sp. TaxID=2901191 RepID=UPI003002DCCD
MDKKVALESSKSVLLSKIDWDDYSYSTKFFVEFFVAGKSTDLGAVKIMSTDLDDGSDLANRKSNTVTKLPGDFQELSDEYFSLGQELEYYRELSNLAVSDSEEILKGLRDCATFCKPSEKVRTHKAFWDSLIRGSEAKKCLEEGEKYYRKIDKKSKIEFSYKSKVFKNAESKLDFVFDIDSSLPSTVNVLIGRNGSGKTRLLSKLSEDIVSGSDDRVFSPSRPLISRVVAISYSAFDNFKIPAVSESGGKDYRYIGMRKRSEHEEYKIKTNEDHWEDISNAISIISDKALIAEIERFIAVSMFEQVFNVQDLTALEPVFNQMSSGQKISLSIICQLLAFLEDDSLVLFDEPENHLHPGLLWSMMVSFDKVLKIKKSFAIVATHSPLILQQVPSEYVNVVNRYGSVITAEKLSTETFGENLQAIMERVFGFVDLEYDYKSIFASLLDSGFTKENIEKLFFNGLSLQARTVLSTISKKEKND